MPVPPQVIPLLLDKKMLATAGAILTLLGGALGGAKFESTPARRGEAYVALSNAQGAFIEMLQEENRTLKAELAECREP